MPVQFVCSKCHRRLSVGSRKAGCAVACPKCGHENTVPQPAAGDSASSSVIADVPCVQPSPPVSIADAQPEPFDFNGFDDVLHLIGEKPADAAPLPARVADVKPPVVAPPPISVGTADRGPVTIVTGPPPIPPAAVPVVGVGAPPVRSTIAHRGAKQPHELLLRARRALNGRTGIVAGLVVFAFVAGWLTGRSGQPKVGLSRPEPPGEPVPLEGRVLYALSPGHSLSDERAVVLALPAAKKPETKIDVRGLRPADDDDLDTAPSADALRALGGSVVRADERGEFVLVLPRPGNYWVLVISRHASRPGELAIGMSDAKEIGGYFTSPSELIGQQRYSLSSRRLVGAPPKLVHEFGPTDKK